jgi:acetyl-CoA carboxylase biotin carboxyl carrier protein
VNTLNEFNLTEIEFTEKDTKIKVSKNNISINNQTTPIAQNPSNITESAPKAKNTTSGTPITSPIIGTAYHAPEPGAKNL